MSVCIEYNYGWVVCSEKYFNYVYCLILSEDLTSKHFMVIKKPFFDIKTPFFTDCKSKKFGKLLQSETTSSVSCCYTILLFIFTYLITFQLSCQCGRHYFKELFI